VGKITKRSETPSESISQEETIPEPEIVESEFLTIVGEPEQLTFGEDPSAFGSIHRSGEKIVFQSLTDKRWQLFELDLSISDVLEEDMESESTSMTFEARPLLETDTNDESPVWDYNDERVFFVSSAGESAPLDRDILMYDPTAEVILPVIESPGDDWNPVCMPDGRIVFLSERDAGNEESEYKKANGLYIADADGMNVQKIAGEYSDYCCPVSVDDNHIVVLNKDDRLLLLALESSSEEILTPSRIKCGSATYCAEKDWLIFTGWENGTSALYALSIKDKKIQQIAIAGYDVTYPQISPDGSWMLFSSKINGQYQLFRISLNGE